MIPRALTDDLLASLKDTPVVLLIGPRQSGKSTLAEALGRYGHDAEYTNLDDTETLAAAQRDPGGFLDRFPGSVIIDEIQRAPELLLPIKAAVDRDRRPGRFLLTGSTNALVLPAVSDALVGRVAILNLWPFTQAEMEGRPQPTFLRRVVAPEELPEPRPAPGGRGDESSLIDRLLRGGFPEVVGREEPVARQRWFAAYLTTVIERDLRHLVNVERPTAIPALLASVAARTRGPLNRNALSQELGLPYSTLARYLSLLELSFVVKQVPAWHGKVHRRLAKTSKLLVSDSGLHCHLLKLDRARLEQDETTLGIVLEAFVGMELVKGMGIPGVDPDVMHFRAVPGAEIDFVVETRGGAVAGVEVKAARSLSGDEFRHLASLRDMLGERFVRGVLLYRGHQVLPFGDRLVAWPLRMLG